ncbi:hypothetical protein NMY22_g434 [Coprinellus aureogranulatus]|nr:hypothetical protein NMY22_g434 [Coprinellus aureogranulatus]
MSFPVPGVITETTRFPDLTARLHQQDQFPFALGEHSDLFRARKLNDTRPKPKLFVIKTLRAGSSSNPNFYSDLQKKLVNRGDALAQLNHENICPLHGIAYGTSRLPGLVMDYYEGGSIITQMSKRRFTDEAKLSWVKQIACGLRYLHHRSAPIVHGDVRGSNIFLDASGKIVIGDVQMVYLTDSYEFAMHQTAATARWAAPERLDPKLAGPNVPAVGEGPDCTLETDVFAFAMTIIEIFTEALPFAHIHYDTAVIFAILRNERPQLPQYIQDHTVLGRLVKDCWAKFASKRPRMNDICCRLGKGASS